MARPKLSSSSRRAIAQRCRAGRGATPATVAAHLEATLLQVLCAVAVPRTRYLRIALVAREPLNFDRHMAEMSDRKFQRLYRLSKVDFIHLSLLFVIASRMTAVASQGMQPKGENHSNACGYDANSCGSLLLGSRMALWSGGCCTLLVVYTVM
jgi:hypothetical protein